MVYKFELTVVNSSHSYPMHIWGCAWIYCWPKKLLKIRTGLLLEQCGPRGQHSLTAIGLLATGPWATGLLLAKLLLGITVISRQIENNACAKYYGANKVWYHVEMENYAEMRKIKAYFHHTLYFWNCWATLSEIPSLLLIYICMKTRLLSKLKNSQISFVF